MCVDQAGQAVLSGEVYDSRASRRVYLLADILYDPISDKDGLVFDQSFALDIDEIPAAQQR